MGKIGNQTEFDLHDIPPGTSVIPGVWAARLENLGLVEVLAGMPDYAKHQRVRWLIDGFERLQGDRFPTATESLASIADELQQLRTLFTNGYATIHVTSPRDPG